MLLYFLFSHKTFLSQTALKINLHAHTWWYPLQIFILVAFSPKHKTTYIYISTIIIAKGVLIWKYNDNLNNKKKQWKKFCVLWFFVVFPDIFLLKNGKKLILKRDYVYSIHYLLSETPLFYRNNMKILIQSTEM